MKLDGVRQSCPDMLACRLHALYEVKPVNWQSYREINEVIDKTTKQMERWIEIPTYAYVHAYVCSCIHSVHLRRCSLHELQLNEVPTINNEPLVKIYEDAAPKSRGTKRRLHASSPSLLWNKNGPEMTCLGTIADLEAHEAIMQSKKEDKANRRAKRFVDKVLSLHTHAYTHNYDYTYIYICRWLDTARPKRLSVIGWCMKSSMRMVLHSIQRTGDRPGQNVSVLHHRNATISYNTCTRFTTQRWEPRTRRNLFSKMWKT